MKLLLPIEYIIALTSIASIAAILAHIPTNLYWSIIALLILLLFLILNRLYFNLKKKANVSRLLNTAVIFLLYFLIQLLLVFSGNVYGPLFILFHLTIFGTAVAIRYSVAIFFSLSTLSVLLAQILLTPVLRAEIMENPWVPIIYLISLVVMFPITYMVLNKYEFLSQIVDLLGKQVQFIEERESSILQSVQELVFVTDNQFQIVSRNEQARKFLGQGQSDILFLPFHDVVHLYTKEHKLFDPQTDPKAQLVFSGKIAQIISPLWIELPRELELVETSLEMKPIADYEHTVQQVSFILTLQNNVPKDQKITLLIEQERSSLAHQRDELFSLLLDKTKTLSRSDVMRLVNAEWDLINAFELSETSANFQPEIVDVGAVWEKISKTHTLLANERGVALDTIMPGRNTETEFLPIINTQVTLPAYQRQNDLRIMASEKWVTLLLEKLLEIQIYLSSSLSVQDKKVHVEFQSTDADVQIRIRSGFITNNADIQKFFSVNPEPIPQITAIEEVTGLEGFLASQIANYISAVLQVDASDNNLTITLTLHKQAVV